MERMPVAEFVKIFVYGTLKPGECNYEAYCAGHVTEVQEAITYGELFDLPFDYPAMTEGDRPVYGYLLSANLAILSDLDELEGYSPDRHDAENEYVRQEIEVFSLQGHPLGNAWVYLMTAEQAIDMGGVLLPDGKWTSSDPKI
jgi:gamma-glutamylcyclotransferase (GGCT)/AIG2-like uncharacterized protein YtfP